MIPWQPPSALPRDDYEPDPLLFQITRGHALVERYKDRVIGCLMLASRKQRRLMGSRYFLDVNTEYHSFFYYFLDLLYS